MKIKEIKEELWRELFDFKNYKKGTLLAFYFITILFGITYQTYAFAIAPAYVSLKPATIYESISILTYLIMFFLMGGLTLWTLIHLKGYYTPAGIFFLTGSISGTVQAAAILYAFAITTMICFTIYSWKHKLGLYAEGK